MLRSDGGGAAGAASLLRRGWPWLGVAGRLLLGGIWLAAGLVKLPDPAASVRAVRAYQVLPESVVPLVGYGLPVLEVAVGLLLLAGVAVRLAGGVSALLLVLFVVGVAQAWARGLTIDCGCFGGGGQVAASETRYPEEVARDLGLLAVALALAWRPHTRWALGDRADSHARAAAGEPRPVGAGEAPDHGQDHRRRGTP